MTFSFMLEPKVQVKQNVLQSVVLKLCENLPTNCNHLLFLDNWFSTLPLMLKLKSLGYPTTATVRKIRIANCPLKSEKDLKKDGRGSYDYRTDANSDLHIVRWLDNKCVQLVSTYAGVKALHMVKRWDGTAKKHIDVKCPDMISQYNESVGGVDLADMLIAMYRTKIKTKRWYLKVLFHCIDIAKVNAWLLYHRHCDLKKVPKKHHLPLLHFCLEISACLIRCGMAGIKRKAGRPPLDERHIREKAEKKGRKPDMPLPAKVARLDNSHHWPE